MRGGAEPHQLEDVIRAHTIINVGEMLVHTEIRGGLNNRIGADGLDDDVRELEWGVTRVRKQWLKSIFKHVNGEFGTAPLSSCPAILSVNRSRGTAESIVSLFRTQI